ncbi:MAG: flagellar basal body rod protein FlgB [Candidatus Eisenbacteria sp.]|nr:flagellar basal body rod protein FlgB [Candidatus Eisenbacteria bacterium]
MTRIGQIDKGTLAALRGMLDLSALRQSVHAGNIANADAPGYQRREVTFADELGKAQGRGLRPKVTHPGHLDAAVSRGRRLEIREVPSGDGSGNVDLEKEAVALAENELRFSVAAKLTVLRLQSLRSSIKGS